MTVKYDNEVDALYITLSKNAVAESDEGSEGVILDYDNNENIIGIEILNASKRVAEPNKMDFTVNIK